MFADNIWLSGMSEKFVGHATGVEGDAARRFLRAGTVNREEPRGMERKGRGPRNLDFRGERVKEAGVNIPWMRLRM